MLLDNQIIKQATEEALSEMDLSERRFEIEPAFGAANGETTRQIRIFDEDGADKSAIVDFSDKDGNISVYFEEIKEKIRKRLEVLLV